MSIEQQLTTLAESLRIQLLADPKPEALEPVHAAIGPELPDLQITQILEGDIDLTATIQPLTAVRKDVRFSDQFPEVPTGDQESFEDLDEAANVIGGMPITTLGISGVPGVIAQLSGLVTNLKGKIPIPSTTSAPVTMQVRWFVTDTKDGTTELQEGQDYFAPGGLLGREASFLFPPKFQEQTPPPAPVLSRWLYARVKLLAGGVSSPEVTLPGLEIKVPSLLLAVLLGERFKLSLPEVTLPPATPVLAELIETQVQNPFTRLRELVPGIGVSFSYTLSRGTQTPAGNEVVAGPGSAFPPSGSWSVGSLLRFYLRPALETLKATSSQTEWTLEARASVSGLPDTTSPVTVSLPPVQLLQLPVLLPTLVAGFDELWWEVDEAIVFVQHHTPLFHGYVDRPDTAGAEAVKAALLAPLDAAVSALMALVPLFPDLLVSGEDQLNHLGSFVQKLRARPASNLVLTAEQQHDDLGTYDPGWYDRISSLFMIGVPGGATTLKLFEGKSQQSHELHLRMPSGFVAASYWTIHESAFQDLSQPFDSPPTIPAPGREQDGRSASYPFGAFGNMAKSFRWDP